MAGRKEAPRMSCVVIVGAQWGDEGKGKIVDIYTEFADMVVRHLNAAGWVGLCVPDFHGPREHRPQRLHPAVSRLRRCRLRVANL